MLDCTLHRLWTFRGSQGGSRNRSRRGKEAISNRQTGPTSPPPYLGGYGRWTFHTGSKSKAKRLYRTAVLAGWLVFGVHAADLDLVVRDGIEFIQVPAGTFVMGTSDADQGSLQEQKLWNRFAECERPPHWVTISKPFLLSRGEITQKQWKAVMGKNPSGFQGEELPVESVTWEDVQQFLKKLNEKGKGRYRLPTEAEWEYCCRAGSTNRFGLGRFYETLSAQQIACYAWFRANSDNRTHPVGEKLPNAWGFYDIHGNVWEWCQDWYSDTYYARSPATDPCNNEAGIERVFRGGSWFLDWSSLRASCRSGNPPEARSQYLGFRLAADLGAD